MPCQQSYNNCLFSDLSSSPPGPYGQEQYVFRPEEHFKAPPILPPHLLQVILNKDTNISVSALSFYTTVVCLHLDVIDLVVVRTLTLMFSLSLQCDPALLPEPNHVMLNHLYALSIKVVFPYSSYVSRCYWHHINYTFSISKSDS